MSARKGLVMVFLASVCFSVGGLLVKMIPWQGLSINASLVAGIEPVLNPILVALVVGETLSGWSILGGIVVFVTVMVYNVVMARKEKRETARTDSGSP